ncbi:MAG: hypothetical protein AAF723_02975 [Pseudomonadota bacterium]
MKIISSLFVLSFIVGCAAGGPVVSSMNFLQSPIEPMCVQEALLTADGYSVKTPLSRQQTAYRLNTFFNDDLPVTGIIRNRKDGTSEVSFFTKLDKQATPLDRLKADYAIGLADEVVYQQCTEDGKLKPEDSVSGNVIIEAKE